MADFDLCLIHAVVEPALHDGAIDDTDGSRHRRVAIRPQLRRSRDGSTSLDSQRGCRTEERGAQEMLQRVHPERGALRMTPHVVAAVEPRLGVASLAPTEEQIVVERMQAHAAHVGIRGEEPRHIEVLVRVTRLGRRQAAELAIRAQAPAWRIGVAASVPLVVEEWVDPQTQAQRGSSRQQRQITSDA